MSSDDDGNDQRKLDPTYQLPLQVAQHTRAGASTTMNDNESGVFMSEPSESDGGSSRRDVMRSPLLYPINPHSQPNSPGNTSLSSWESPAVRQIHLQFVPESDTVPRTPNLRTTIDERPTISPRLLPKSSLSSSASSNPPRVSTEDSKPKAQLELAGPDDSMAMTLSDSSEDEKNSAARTDVTSPLQWELTLRKKGHRRQRSGDDKAAKIMTGKSGFTGMIPMRRSDGEANEIAARQAARKHRESQKSIPEDANEEAEDEQSENDEDNDDDDSDDEEANVQRNRLNFAENGDFNLDDIEHDFEDRKYRGTYQNVMRPKRNSFSGSPFANIGKKSAEKATRRIFLPQASIFTDDEMDKYPTFVCPRCNTRQREFFGVNDAPNQLEGPTGYLAFYFSIYVLASLFIFGLEEGWAPIDCVYFSVVTLTTAGLGDFVPTTNANKIVCSVFIYFGVACIGLLLGSYIAGMLDDKASKDAKRKRLDACPNCARIRKIKREERLNSPTAMSTKGNGSAIAFGRKTAAMSERHIDLPVHHQAKYVSHHAHNGGKHHNSKAREHQGLVETPPMQTEKTYGSIPENFTLNSQSPQSIPSLGSMGSPVTKRILSVQKHTRHDSFDTSFHNLKSAPQTASRARKYSADFSTPQPIRETVEFIPTSAPSASKEPWNGSFQPEEGEDDDGDDDSYMSVDSVSTGEDFLDDGKAKLMAAKYVFVTLRQALINSMIIIAVGCCGFMLIEGFSVIDSWYFVTVFLTTVGYGDIVPVTKGGKLFATVYILVAGTILLNNMSLISMIPLELRRRRIERAVLTQFGDQLDDAALKELATGPVIQNLHLAANRTDGLDEATREMFALSMLVRLGKVSEEDILQTFAAFRRLDVNNDGVLNSRSIIAGMYKKRREDAKRSSQVPPPPPPIFGEVPLGDASTHARLNKYWVGDHGSLHVTTPGGVYHFDRLSSSRASSTVSSQYEAALSENSTLLQPEIPPQNEYERRRSAKESPF